MTALDYAEADPVLCAAVDTDEAALYALTAPGSTGTGPAVHG